MWLVFRFIVVDPTFVRLHKLIKTLQPAQYETKGEIEMLLNSRDIKMKTKVQFHNICLKFALQ